LIFDVIWVKFRSEYAVTEEEETVAKVVDVTSSDAV